jgi:hypothetical protein
MLVHMTPGEVRGLQGLAMAHGGSLTINPHTGLPEAGILDSLLPTLIGVGLTAATGGAAAPWMIGAGVGGITALASGSLAKGLQAGLGAFGGAGLGGALFGSEAAGALGAEAAQREAIQQAASQNVDSILANMGANNPPPLVSYEKVASEAASEFADKPWYERAGASVKAGFESPGSFGSNVSQQLGGKYGVMAAAAPTVLAGLQALNPPAALQNNAAAQNKGNIRPYQYTVGQVDPEAQRQVSQFGFSKLPYFTGQGYTAQPIYAAAAGGQVPQPSMPLDLSQNYPGSNISKSSYATLPATESQEVVDGYGPKINPFTGAEGMAAGGIAALPEYAAGGKLLRGPGDGMSDDIPAVIKGETPQRAALADGEFVIPADVVSHLGNGSTDAGAKRLYTMMDRVRKARTGNPKQGKQINAERLMPA